MAFALMVFGPPAFASPTPFVDGPFATSSIDEDPDLILVREKFNPLSRIQSIYLRFNDGTSDREILSGTLTIHGAEITTVLLDRQTLKETDLTWGIEGVNYGLDRGLEGEDPSTTMPFIGSDDDLLVAQGKDVRFWLSTSSDIDDFRVLIQYPEEHQEAHISVVFWHLRGRDVEGYPVTTPGANGETGGIVVGSQNDVSPDDGDYGEILSIGHVRLKTEDLDIQEDVIELGQVDHRGGVLGPSAFTIDNFLNSIDFDGDNEADYNGNLNPVPNQGHLNQLKVLTTTLQNENGDQIPTDQIQVLGIPERIEERAIQEALVSVTVSPNTPTGNYRGFLTVWEDNDMSDTIDLAEPVDNLILSLEVIRSDRPDLGTTLLDSGVSVDMGVGPNDIGIDARVPADAQTNSDALLDADLLGDASTMTDGSHEADVLLDISSPDGSTIGGDVMPLDGLLRDVAPQDVRDAMTSTDSGSTETWSGQPTGGGLQCTTPSTKHLGHAPLYLVLFLFSIRRRRKC